MTAKRRPRSAARRTEATGAVLALDPHCWYDIAGHFSCSEAQTLAEFFRAHGAPDLADRFIGVHGESDEEGDDHYDPNAGHDDTECRHCGYPVVHGSGAAVTCDMCGPYCCEAHHRQHPSYERHDIAPDVVHPGEWCDACTHPESLHDERIRTVGDGVAPCTTCAVCVAVHTGDPGDDESDIEEYDHSRAKEDARNARYRR